MLSQDNKISICCINSYFGLEDFLLDLGYTKSSIKRFIPSNKLRKKPLSEKSEVHIDIDLINQKKISPAYKGPEYKVLLDNELLLVLSKPINSHSNSQRYSDRNTSTSWLRANSFKVPLEVNKEQLNRGLINRLDYETSGVLIYFKDESEYFNARSSIHSYLIHKEYRAIVEGKFPDNLLMEDFLSSRGEKGKEVFVCNEGTTANSEASLLSYNEQHNLSFIKVVLKTGLRHQIRVQLSSRGFPILGDKLYSGKDSDRLYLHAFSYHIQINGNIFEIKDDSLEGRLFDFYSSL